jgi:pyridinium-3,5-bisthiocarboxylic acid mononucleotide nickel chelatase
MRRIIYFDPCAGAAGDMINAALIDSGADLAAIQAAIASLGINGLSVHTEPVLKGAIGALHLVVTTSDPNAVPSYLSQHDLHGLADRAEVSPYVREHAHSIIDRLVDAEAHVHRLERDNVHFHELGGLDTIIDILGALVALESLKVEACYTGPLPCNGGTWGIEHGQLPLPMPATLEIIARGKLAVTAASAAIPPNKELVTPTGAAILAEIACPGLPTMQLERIGYGAGTRDLPIPNIIRAWIGIEAQPGQSEHASKHTH